MKGSQVTAAVRKLRLGLDDTQQGFAQRLGMAIATVVRYEHNRPPSGRALAKLERLATEHGFQEYAAVFRKALGEELGAIRFATLKSLECSTEEERVHVEALLTIFRCWPDSKQAAAIKKILKPQVDGARQIREAEEAFEESRRAVVRLLKAGRTVEEVGKSFRAEHIADALFEFGGPALIEQSTGNVVELLVKDRFSIKEIADRWFDSNEDEVIKVAVERGLYEALPEDESDQAESE
jgi:transcriptional regulator with XRE-family HTH domain